MSAIECCVCFEELPEDVEMTDCEHTVCQDCLGKLRQPTCPMCRAPIELVGEAAARQRRREYMKKLYENDVKLHLRIALRLRGYRVLRL